MVPFALPEFAVPVFNAGKESKIWVKWKRHVVRFEPYKLSRIALIPFYFTNMADLLGAVESNIVHAKENEALDFRNMQMAQCSMTGVAAALVAQVANSTLQLQYMPTIHWTIPALCTCSLILGLLSLSYVLQLHYSLANLTSAVDLRKAFTWRAPDGTDGSNEGAEARSGDGGRGGGGERGEGAGVGTPGQLEAGTGVGTLGQVGAGTGAGTLGQVGAGSDPERASYEATFILWLPFALFRIAIYLYLAAILSYWGVAAKMDLQESRARSTNVFAFSWIALSVVVYESFLRNGGLGQGIEQSSQQAVHTS